MNKLTNVEKIIMGKCLYNVHQYNSIMDLVSGNKMTVENISLKIEHDDIEQLILYFSVIVNKNDIDLNAHTYRYMQPPNFQTFSETVYMIISNNINKFYRSNYYTAWLILYFNALFYYHRKLYKGGYGFADKLNIPSVYDSSCHCDLIKYVIDDNNNMINYISESLKEKLTEKEFSRINIDNTYTFAGSYSKYYGSYFTIKAYTKKTLQSNIKHQLEMVSTQLNKDERKKNILNYCQRVIDGEMAWRRRRETIMRL